MSSRVEEIARAGRPLRHAPAEKAGVIIVDSFPALGTLAALRFIEWVQANPEGVIALPTGKTPEFFIKEVTRLTSGWKRKPVQDELAAGGIDPAVPCSMRGLSFVQIDEFYPIDPRQHNSFYHYVNRYYIEGFKLDPQRAMLIDATRILPPGRTLADVWPEDDVDLSLRYRMAASKQEQLQRDVIQHVDEWCTEYEERIRAMGGIGFFLGGIGPDGHIGFNVRGSDPFSTTRLTQVNYETQAAAATDLGGIEVARRRLVITIGLSTITFKPDCTAIIIAAGEAKANIVRDAIQNVRHVRYPATALHELPNARFYLTQGAAKKLDARRVAAIATGDAVTAAQVEQAVIDLCMSLRKPIDTLTEKDFQRNPITSALMKRGIGSVGDVCARTSQLLRDKIVAGATLMGGAFLHTEPHHDDLMLGCLPFIVRHIRDHSTHHTFATMTSGFTAVTNHFMLEQCDKLLAFMDTPLFATLYAAGAFDPHNASLRNGDVWHYLDGVAAARRTMQDEGESRRLYRNLVELFGENGKDQVEDHVEELIDYFESAHPGKKDPEHVQRLKGMCREWEAECLWGYFGWKGESVRHLRLGFYTGDIFPDEPTRDRDIPPITNLLREVRPNVVTLALDPEASGPDTHYKVLQAITESLKLYEQESGAEIAILGYRNVWYRFEPSEADLFVPISLNMLSLQHSAFMNAFASQREASFPSPEHDGPFSELAQKIQVEQYQTIKTCLGREFFDDHPSALIRATRGFAFLKRMNLEELYRHSRQLKRSTELPAQEEK
ncbi:MAG TPA: glucosamine-6-phosphate deaminase [Candidatus Krumholzibacteria bacterium]|nr:glucosamine-6-phosphate deaminase [Candidatus Krumholzibacteria bacterium]